MMKIAIGSGDSVTTWDFKTSQVLAFQPHKKESITHLAWNHNGQVIASCSVVRSDETVVLTSVSNTSAPERFYHDFGLDRPQPSTAATTTAANATAATTTKSTATTAATTKSAAVAGPVVGSLCFGGKSRYLLCGDTAGTICLWDLKKKSRVRNYFHTDKSPSIQVQMSESFVFSLSATTFHVFDLRQCTLAHTVSVHDHDHNRGGTSTSAAAAPPPLGTDGTFQYTRFSVTKQFSTVVALGRTDGQVALVDWQQPHAPLAMEIGPLSTNSSSASSSSSSLPSHSKSPITGLCFSATNPELLIATSKAGTISFLDILKQKRIRSVEIAEPIGCLDFSLDGSTYAIGTDTGKVMVYDLRKPNEALDTLQLTSAIKALEFSPKSASLATPGGMPSQNLLDEITDPLLERGDSGGPAAATTIHGVGGADSLHRNLTSSHDERPSYHQLHHPNSTMTTGGNTAIPPSTLLHDHDNLAELITESTDMLRDEMERSIRNIHADMIVSFHRQSNELRSMLAQQMQVMDKILLENERLRDENKQLRDDAATRSKRR